MSNVTIEGLFFQAIAFVKALIISVNSLLNIENTSTKWGNIYRIVRKLLKSNDERREMELKRFSELV